MVGAKFAIGVTYNAFADFLHLSSLASAYVLRGGKVGVFELLKLSAY